MVDAGRALGHEPLPGGVHHQPGLPVLGLDRREAQIGPLQRFADRRCVGGATPPFPIAMKHQLKRWGCLKRCCTSSLKAGVLEKVRDLRLAGLDLVVGLPDVGAQVSTSTPGSAAARWCPAPACQVRPATRRAWGALEKQTPGRPKCFAWRTWRFNALNCRPGSRFCRTARR